MKAELSFINSEITSLKDKVNQLYKEIEKNEVDEFTKGLIDGYIVDLLGIVDELKGANVSIARTDLLNSLEYQADFDREAMNKLLPASVTLPLDKCLLQTQVKKASKDKG